MKVKDIKAKVAAKICKAKAKIESKASNKKKCCALIAFASFASVFLCGCSTADAPTAQRAQTVTAEDIAITINLAPGLTNAAAPAISIEIATAAQANETAGTETMTATNTQTPTTDVKPTTTVNYGLTSTSASGTDWISQLTSASAQGLAAWLKSGTANGSMTVTKSDGSTETVTCKDGSCTTASGDSVTCKDGVCAPAGD